MKLNKSFSFVILGMALATLASCSGSGRKFYKLIEEVPATCTRGGMLAHYESQPDGDKETIYLNVDKKQVELEDLIIPALGHDMTYVPEQYATCDKEGVIAHYHCANCNLDYEDEVGQVLADDLHTSTKGHVMDQEWTQSETENKHYHKCAREGCTHIDDETDCVFDQEVVKEEYAVEGEDNKYYKSCVCGRKGAETFEHTPNVVSIDEEGWEDTLRSKADLVEYDPSDEPITLGDIGINAPTWTSLSDAHAWGTYDLVDNGGIDLTFDIKLEDDATIALSVYVGSKAYDETGMIFRFDYNPSTQKYGGYIYHNVEEKFDDNDLPGAGEENGTKYTIPDFTTTEKTITARITLTQDTSNPYKFAFALYVNGHKAISPNSTPLKESVTFNGTDARNIIRFTQTSASKIKDKEFPPRFILMDENGNCIGSKEFSNTNINTVTLPDLSSSGHKFAGYYDTKGVRFTNSTEVNTRVVVCPHFIEVGDAPSHTVVTLSDLGLLKQGLEASTTNNKIAGDFEEGFRRIPVGGKTTSVSISFVAQFKFAKKRGGKVVDDYFQFGLPYDYKDNQTRFIFRINADSGVNSLRGYVGGPATSLGAHGTEGTFFSDEKFVMNEDTSYLITMSYGEVESNSGLLSFTFAIENLGTFSSSSFTYEGVEFINSDDFSFNNPYRNYFSVIRSRADAVLTMQNAW